MDKQFYYYNDEKIYLPINFSRISVISGEFFFVENINVDNTIIIAPIYGISEQKLGVSNNFYVKLSKEEGDTILLRMIAQEQKVQIVEQIPYMPLWYILSIRKCCSHIGRKIYKGHS